MLKLIKLSNLIIHNYMCICKLTLLLSGKASILTKADSKIHGFGPISFFLFWPHLNLATSEWRFSMQEGNEVVEGEPDWKWIHLARLTQRHAAGVEKKEREPWRELLITEFQTPDKAFLSDWGLGSLLPFLGDPPKHLVQVATDTIHNHLGKGTIKDPILFPSWHLTSSESVLLISRFTNSFSVSPCQFHDCFPVWRALPATREAPAE